jgi:predicted amidophosphoribosyltransferase
VLLPASCALCGGPAPSPCPTCRVALPRSRPEATSTLPGVDRFAALFAYEGPARALVSGIKYRNRRASLPWLADELAALLPDRPDLVTWVPTTRARRRERGFDQSRLLAKRVAWALGRPVLPTLRRQEGPPQTGRSAAERRCGPVFEARRRLHGATVLLVDDVVTTGATLGAAASALRSSSMAGAVWAVALARTPLKGAPARADS